MERRAARQADPPRQQVACAAARCRSGCSPAPGFRGTLAFTLPEALWLAAAGVDDMLVAYPTADRGALRELGRGPSARAARHA